MVEWWLSKNVEKRKYSSFCWTNCFTSHVYMSRICMSAVNIKQSHMDWSSRSKHNIIQEQTHLMKPKVKTVHGHKEFPHVDNPDKALCILFTAVEKSAQYIWLLPWTTLTHTDVIFPTAPSPSLFLSFSLPNALSLDWIAPGHKPQWPCGAAAAPPASWGVEVAWLMSGNPISQHNSPLQLVASVMPYSLINQRDPCCAHRSLSEQQQRTYTGGSALELWISTLLDINP